MKRKMTRITALFLIALLTLVPFLSINGSVFAATTTFEQTLALFPASYRANLTSLHNLHPNWIFEPITVDDDWATVISNETNPETRNLVPKSTKLAWLKNYTVGDGSSWVPASKNIVEYYMDPRNFLSEKSVFQFERLSYDATTQTAGGVNAIFGTNQGLLSLTPYVMKAAQTANVSAYLLASRMKQEISDSSSYGICNSARGDINLDYPPLTAGGISPCFMTPAEQLAQLQLLPNPTAVQSSWLAGLLAIPRVPIPAPAKRYYNLFNVGATPNPNVMNGARLNAINYAMGSQSTDYNLPWDSQEKAAIGGATFIAENYVAQGQDTMYFQKFAVSGKLTNRYWHQFMQNLQAADSEGQRYYLGYQQAGALNNAYTFRIPVFSGMPASVVPLPTVTASLSQPNALSGYKGQTMQVVGSTTYNVRSQPSALSAALGKTPAGGTFVIQSVVAGQTTDYGNLWYQVQYNGQTAYIIVDLNGQIIQAKGTFDSQGGSAVNPMITNYYSKITAPPVPARAGYTFIGWFKEPACTNAWNFSADIVPASITLYAKWFDAQKMTTDFVTRCYQLLLGRAPDPVGLANWVNALQSGKITGADVAKGFWDSIEFQNRNVSDADFVTILYQALFNRGPDGGGYNSWISTLDNGMSRYSVLAGFVNSTEFKNLAATYGVIPGALILTQSADLYPQVTAFVTRLYKQCLNRMPDSAGVNAWVTSLKNGKSTGADVAYGFLFSAEYQGLKVTNEVYVTNMYRAFLNRDADAAGYNSWLNALNTGKSRYNVLAGFVNSPEFSSLCQVYAIKSGTLRLNG